MQMQQTHASTPISYQNKTQHTKHTNISGQNQSHTAAATLDKQITFRLSTSAVGKKKCIDTLMAKIVKKKKKFKKKKNLKKKKKKNHFPEKQLFHNRAM